MSSPRAQTSPCSPPPSVRSAGTSALVADGTCGGAALARHHADPDPGPPPSGEKDPMTTGVNPRAHGPGAARRGPLRSTSRTIRGTTGAGTIAAAPAPPMVPRHTHSHRIIFHDGVLASVRTGGTGPAPTGGARVGPRSRHASPARRNPPQLAQCELSSTKSTSARFVRAYLAQCELR